MRLTEHNIWRAWGWLLNSVPSVFVKLKSAVQYYKMFSVKHAEGTCARLSGTIFLWHSNSKYPKRNIVSQFFWVAEKRLRWIIILFFNFSRRVPYIYWLNYLRYTFELGATFHTCLLVCLTISARYLDSFFYECYLISSRRMYIYSSPVSFPFQEGGRL